MHCHLLHQKQVFLIFLFALLSTAGFSQYVHKIKVDSVKIANDSCNAELILENNLRHLDGFLNNKRNRDREFGNVLSA